MPLDVRLSLNCCIHQQGSEAVARNLPICLRVRRVTHTSPRLVIFKRRKWFEHPFSYGTVPFSITIAGALLRSHGVTMPIRRSGVDV